MANVSFTQEEKAAAKLCGDVLVCFAANGKDAPAAYPFREFELAGPVPPELATEACLWFASFVRRAAEARQAAAQKPA